MRKYWAIFVTQLVNSLAYPGEIVWRSLAIVIFLWVFTYLWQVAYSNAATSTIAGLTLRDTIWYLMLAETIELSRPRFAVNIAQSVKDGSIAYLLNKPYDYLLYQLCVTAGDTVFRLILTMMFGSVLVWAMVGPHPNLIGWPFALVALAAGWLINFCITCLIGLSAFVVEEVAPFMWIYQKFIFILGGMMIPIDFYPAWLKTVSKATPFSYIMYGPSRLFVSPDLLRLTDLMIGQAAWILVLGLVLFLIYRRGLQHLSINGG
jgi:ABC-2 type transport system permease protein